MRNLKRALSLVMAAAMLIGMMVISASAAGKDFTDMDEIDHVEAVEVMTALNVISGKEDGSYYDPTGSLTRAEMAKIVAYVMNGGVEPNIGTKLVPTYSDIDNHWAEAYIEYCTSMGIIAGDGAGKFNPEGTLTGEQAAKMFLTAMGYNANVFGFTGNDWAINVGRYANEAGLYKSLGDVVPSATISRDDAAQMAYNAIQATMMRRTWSQDLTTGQLTETYVPWVSDDGTTRVTLLSDKFDGNIKYAYVVDFTFDEVKGLWTYYFDTGANFGGDAIPTNDRYSGGPLTSADNYTDLYGQQVKIIYNTEDDDVIYGIYANNSSVVVSGASGELGTIDDTARTIKVGGVAYRLGVVSTAVDVFDNGYGATSDTLATLKAGQLANAFTFKLVDNTGDGKIDAVIRTPMFVTQIIYVGTNTISFNNQSQMDRELVNIYDDYAQGDWTYYTPASYSATCIPTFEKAELQTATVDGVKGSDVATGYSDFQLSGSWFAETTNAASPSLYSVATAEVNDTIEYVTLGSVLFYAKVVDVASTTKNVAMLITADDIDAEGAAGALGGATVKGKLLLADGSKVTETIAKLDGADVDDASDITSTIGSLVTYRINSDGAYELRTVSTSGTSAGNATGNYAGYTGADDATGDGSSTYGYDGDKIGAYELADDAVVFVMYDGAKGAANGANNGKVYTGKEINNAYDDLGTYAQVLYGMQDGFYYGKVAGIVTAAEPKITSGSNYGYITSGAYRTVDTTNDKTYLNLTFWTEDGEVKAKFESSDAPAAYPAGALITYDTVSEGEIKNVSIVTDAITGVVKGWDGVSKIQLDSNVAEIDSVDTVVIYVNSKDKVGAEDSGIRIGKDSNNDGEADIANVRYILTGGTNQVVSLLLVDVNAEMQAGPAMTLSGTGVTAAQVNTALSSSTGVTIDSKLTTALTGVTVGNGKNITFAVAQDQNHVITVEAGGSVTLPNGNKVVGGADALATATDDVTVKVNNSGAGVAIEAASGTITLNADVTIDDDDKLTLTGSATLVAAPGTELTIGDSAVSSAVLNFYTSTTGAAPADGTYTYYAANTILKADGTAATHAAGWYTTAGVTAVQGA